jgi:Cdc6-like AAA superfamily ATPase
MPYPDMPQYQHFMKLRKYSFVEVFSDIAYSGSPSDTLQVRGTPAGGKTILAQLLAQYVSQQEPDVDVICVQAWPIEEVENLSWLLRLS